MQCWTGKVLSDKADPQPHWRKAFHPFMQPVCICSVLFHLEKGKEMQCICVDWPLTVVCWLSPCRLHVQSITCSSRSSSTSASWPRPCLWSSSLPLHIYLCTPLQANQPWIAFHPIPRLPAFLTCRPKSNSLHRTPLLLTLHLVSVLLQQLHTGSPAPPFTSQNFAPQCNKCRLYIYSLIDLLIT